MRYLSLFIFILVSTFTIAQDDIPSLSTDRPDQTEGASLIPVNSFQLETGFAANFTGKDERNYDFASTLLRFGYFEKVEFRVIYNMNKSNAPVLRDEKMVHVDPFTVGLKLKLLDKEKTQVGFLAHVAIPYLATQGNRPDNFAPDFRLAINHNITDRYSIGYNVGAAFDGYSDSPSYLYTIVNGFSLTEKLGMFVELYGDFHKDEFPHHHFDMGFTYAVKPNLQIDILGGMGLIDVSDNGFIGAGLVWRKLNLR